MKKKSTNKILQKYIPKILANESYIDRFMAMLLVRYKFKVDRKNFRKKLEVYYRNSCYMSEEKLTEGQTLIKGSYTRGEEGNTIWVSSQHIALMAEAIVKQHVLHIPITMEKVKEKYTHKIAEEKGHDKRAYETLLENYKRGDVLMEFVTPLWDDMLSEPYAGVVLLRDDDVVFGVPDTPDELLEKVNNLHS